MAHATVRIVDPACQPPCYPTIQSAVDAASHGDTIEVKGGTYNEQVTIYPPAQDSNQFYLTFLPLDPNGSSPVITYTIGGDQGTGPGVAPPANTLPGTFEIHNQAADSLGRHCRDLRVTLQGFEIFGQGRGCALSVWSSTNDTTRTYNTGVFLRDNYFESSNGEGTIIMGQKGSAERTLRHQSIKWGEVLNNEIVGLLKDAVTTYHFVGHIANNRIQSASEGWHLGYGRLDAPHAAFLPDTLQTIVEHNVFYCNSMNGLHFTHGSQGIVRNNIFSRNHLDGSGMAVGLDLGAPTDPDDALCEEDPTECIPEVSANGDTVLVEVLAYNNVADMTDGPGVLVHAAVQCSLWANIISRSGQQAAAAPAFHIRSWNYPGGALPPWFYSDYELLWANDTDYGNPAMQGAHDVVTTETSDSHPHFQGTRAANGNPNVDAYSYMLRIDQDPVCGYAIGARSKAINAGPSLQQYEDGALPPGLGNKRCDIGAFGGPHNVWDPTGSNLCLEYTEAVGSCD
jgi:hypothetical protein